MLTAQEIHIEINQGFQRVASNVYDFFQPEEIDWIFNKNQLRFISRCVKSRPDGSGAFEVDEASEQDIQNVIRRDKTLTVNKVDALKGFSFIPADLLYIINDRSRVLTDCKSTFSLNTSSYNIFSHILNFPTSTLSSGNYANLVISKNGSPIFQSSNYNLSSGLSTANQKFVLINLVIEVLLQKGIEVYWEQYNNQYVVNNFIIVSNLNDVFTLSMEGSTPITSTSNLETHNKYQSIYEKEVPNRLTKGSALYEVLNNNTFYKTNDKSPISNVIENKIYLFHSERFIVPELILDYVRKPRKINLSLNRASELSESGVRKVCDLSVEYMKNIVESPAFKMKLEDNIIRME